jgi:hypothetical protein
VRALVDVFLEREHDAALQDVLVEQRWARQLGGARAVER